MKKLLTALTFVSTCFLFPAQAQIPSQLEACVELSNYAGIFHDAKQQGADPAGIITNVALGVDDENLKEVMFSLIFYVFYTPEGEKSREEFLKTFFLECMSVGEPI